jgi:hypothetical protein
MLAELDVKQANLRETLLRISGAIQVLEELLGESAATAIDLQNGSEPQLPTDSDHSESPSQMANPQ